MFSLFGWTALSEVHPFPSFLGITQSSEVTGCFDCLKASKEDWLSRQFPGAPKLLHCTQPRRGSSSGPPLKQQHVFGTAHTHVGEAIAMLEVTSSASLYPGEQSSISSSSSTANFTQDQASPSGKVKLVSVCVLQAFLCCQAGSLGFRGRTAQPAARLLLLHRSTPQHR